MGANIGEACRAGPIQRGATARATACNHKTTADKHMHAATVTEETEVIAASVSYTHLTLPTKRIV